MRKALAGSLLLVYFVTLGLTFGGIFVENSKLAETLMESFTKLIATVASFYLVTRTGENIFLGIWGKKEEENDEDTS